MPSPKDPLKFQEYRERQRQIALNKGYGKWMLGKTASISTRNKISEIQKTLKNTPEQKSKLSAQAIKCGAGKWMKRRKLPFIAQATSARLKNKTYEEIYGENAEREREKRRSGNRIRHAGKRKADIHPTHNGSFEYKEWRTAVLSRDSHRCCACQSKGKLHAHHIKAWARYPELRYDVSNGITLCPSCHKELHRQERAEAFAAHGRIDPLLTV